MVNEIPSSQSDEGSFPSIHFPFSKYNYNNVDKNNHTMWMWNCFLTQPAFFWYGKFSQMKCHLYMFVLIHCINSHSQENLRISAHTTILHKIYCSPLTLFDLHCENKVDFGECMQVGNENKKIKITCYEICMQFKESSKTYGWKKIS